MILIIVFKKNINLSIEKIEISITITADATRYKLFFHKFLTLKSFLFFFFFIVGRFLIEYLIILYIINSIYSRIIPNSTHSVYTLYSFNDYTLITSTLHKITHYP